MKLVKKYGNWNNEANVLINAYQDVDLQHASEVIAFAKDIQYREWVKSGIGDQGTCCGGKAIRVWYLGKGKRKPEQKSIVYCDFVQGNVAAYKSVQPALDFLQSKNVNAEYYDGWMD